MPPAPQSRVSSFRRNVTEVIARFNAATVDVCCAGGVTALHFHTRQGAVVIQLAEREFVKKIRGERDSNGNPFRTLEEIASARITEADKAPAGAPIFKPGGMLL